MTWRTVQVLVELPATKELTDKVIVNAISDSIELGDIERRLRQHPGRIGRPRVKSLKRHLQGKRNGQ